MRISDEDSAHYLTTLGLEQAIDLRRELRVQLRREPKRVAIGTTHRLGDTLVILPAVQAIKEHFPGATLTMIASRAQHEMLSHQPYIDEVVALGNDEWSLHDALGPRGANADVAFLFRRHTIKKRDGERPRWFSISTDVLLGPGRLAHLHYLGALTVLGMLPEKRLPRIELPQKLLDAAKRELDERFGDVRRSSRRHAPGPVVALHPGSYYVGKRWPPQRYREVVRRLHLSYGARFLPVEDRGESELVDFVVQDVPRADVHVLRDRSLTELASLLAHATFYLGNDSGIMHLADAVDRPSITVYGPSRAAVWGATHRDAVHLVPDDVWQGCTECSSRPFRDKPCARSTKDADSSVSGASPCLEHTTVEAVLASVEALLALLGARARGSAGDHIRVSDRVHLKLIMGDRAVLTNLATRKPLHVYGGFAQVERCLEHVRKHGSYSKAMSAMQEAAPILSALLSHRIVVPDRDIEPELPRSLSADLARLFDHPAVETVGLFAAPELYPRFARWRRLPRSKKRRANGRHRLRVLLVNGIDPDVYGGGERWMLRVGEALAARRHEVLCWGVEGHPWLADAEQRGLHRLAGSIPETLDLVHAVDHARRLERLELDAALLAQDREIVSLGLPLRLAKVPVVLARKGLPMVDSRAIVRWAHAAVVDRVLVPARATAQEILKQGWLPKDHIEVIVNGVDSAIVRGAASNGTATRLLRADLGLSPDDRHVLSVARLARHKGTAFLIDAIVHVLESHPRARLLLVGRGEMLPLQRQVDELGIRDRVVFLGERWEIGRVLALADCFVLPSLYEGMSTALLEAMAAGVPVVATRVSGNPEVVRDGVTGLLVPPADPVSLAHAISQVLGDRSRAAKMAKAAKRHVAKEHDFHVMIDAVEGLLRG